MFSVRIESAIFSEKIREFQRLTGQEMAEVVKTQARLLCARLVKLTYPKTSAQGKGKVGADIGKVYLANSWFEETFQFRNKKLGERVQDAVRAKNAPELQAIFSNSSALNKLKIEPFDSSRHDAARKDGRVYYKQPYSFPLTQQSQVKKLVTQEKKAVGTAKAGWALAGSQLGGSLPGWLNKAGLGKADIKLEGANPTITLTNSANVFAALDAKHNIVQRALAGRSRDMIKSAERQLRNAAREAKLA